MRFDMTKKQLLEAATTVFSKMSEGKSDREIADEMGISSEELIQVKAKMFDLKADELRRKPIEHTYVEYMLSQLGNVSDLTEMIDTFRTTKQFNAMVGAVRARAEIYDKLMQKGQECGLIKKVADKKEIVGGIIVTDLSNDDLRKAIVGELAGLKKLADKFGDSSFLALEPPKTLHHGEAYKIPDVEDIDSALILENIEAINKKKKKKRGDNPRSNKSKSNKVHKGRKVKMRPAPINTDN